MLVDPVVLASITSAITLLREDYVKGLASEAGKATWTGIKSLLQWHSDPAPEEIPVKVAADLASVPENVEKLLELLKRSPNGQSRRLFRTLQSLAGE